MSKIIHIMLTAICLALSVAGCAWQEKTSAEPPFEELPMVQIEYLDFEATVSRATDVIIGVYQETLEHDSYSEHLFAVEEVLKGETTAEKIYLRSSVVSVEATEHSPTYVSGALEYERGQRYLLVTERTVSVYYDHDRYVLLADAYIPLSDSQEWSMYSQELDKHWEGMGQENILVQIEALAADSSTQPYYGTAYAESETMDDIMDSAEFIMKVTVNSLFVSSESNGTETYNCTPDQVYKGNLDYLGEDISQGVLVVFFHGTVEKGESYYVLVNKADEFSRIFTLAAKDNSWFEYEEGVLPEWLDEIA